jgi:hypothetical protein
MRFTLVLMSALWVSACFWEEEPVPPSFTDAGGEVQSTSSGASSIDMSIESYTYNADTPGPVFTTLYVRYPVDSTVQLYQDGALIKAFDVDCIRYPAFSDCNSSKTGNVSTIVESDGSHEFELTVIKGSDSRTESFTATIEQASCQSNQSVYDEQMQPILQNSCIRCHGNGTAGLFEATDSWSEIRPVLVSKGDLFYKAPSGEISSHSQANPFSPYGGTYRLFAEMVWRAKNDFTCP